MAGSYHPMAQDMRGQIMMQGYEGLAKGIGTAVAGIAGGIDAWRQQRQEIDFMRESLASMPQGMVTAETMAKFDAAGIGGKRGIFTRGMAQANRMIQEQQWTNRLNARGGGGGAAQAEAPGTGGSALAIKFYREATTGQPSAETMAAIGGMTPRDSTAFNSTLNALGRIKPPAPLPSTAAPVMTPEGRVLGYNVGGDFVAPQKETPAPQVPQVAEVPLQGGGSLVLFKDQQGRIEARGPYGPDKQQQPGGISPHAPGGTQPPQGWGTQDPMGWLFQRPGN